MDIRTLERKLGLQSGDKEKTKLIRKAEELSRVARVRLNGGLGAGEICQPMLCLDLACTLLQIPFERSKGIRFSGASEKVYMQSLQTLHAVLGIRRQLDPRELTNQFGCVRLAETVQATVTTFKRRFTASLTAERRKSADFNRPVFGAVAFYLVAKKFKIKVDKLRLLQVSGASESEFANVSAAMLNLCFDTLGIEKKKKAAEDVKTNRDLLDKLKSKRRRVEGSEDEDEANEMEEEAEERRESYEKWKSGVLEEKAKEKEEAKRKEVKEARKQEGKGPKKDKALVQLRLQFKKPKTG